MIIQTRNAIRSNAKNPLHVQHTTNAKYKKYLHQGYKIQQGYKCVVLKIVQSTSKSTKEMLQSNEINKVLNIKLKLNQST